jgi:hypothetical protein
MDSSSDCIPLDTWNTIKCEIGKNGILGFQRVMADIGVLDAFWFVNKMVRDVDSIRFPSLYYPLWLMLVSEGVEYDVLSWLFTPKYSTPFNKRGCGIEINSDYRGVTALILATTVVALERANRVVFDLIRLGANVRTYSVGNIIPLGTTALHAAASRGDIQSMQLLILAGSDVNVLTTKNVSPIHLAAKNGHLSACKLLVDAGANVKYYCGKEERKQAHIIAKQRGHTAVEMYLRTVLDREMDTIYCM